MRELAAIQFAVGCTATTAGVLAFESSGDIYVADMNGANLGRLTFDGGPFSYNREAAWSPDGSRIAFSKSDGRLGAEIFLIDADGTNLRRLSPEGAYDASPTWSPDGARIAFENRRDNSERWPHLRDERGWDEPGAAHQQPAAQFLSGVVA